MLTLKEAAEYCGIATGKFAAFSRIRPVDTGGGKEMYDIRDCDDFIDNLKQGTVGGDDDVIGKLG
jgi:hypothetical protein